MCPGWGSNPQPWCIGTTLQPTEPPAGAPLSYWSCHLGCSISLSCGIFRSPITGPKRIRQAKGQKGHFNPLTGHRRPRRPRSEEGRLHQGVIADNQANNRLCSTRVRPPWSLATTGLGKGTHRPGQSHSRPRQTAPGGCVVTEVEPAIALRGIRDSRLRRSVALFLLIKRRNPPAPGFTVAETLTYCSAARGGPAMRNEGGRGCRYS